MQADAVMHVVKTAICGDRNLTLSTIVAAAMLDLEVYLKPQTKDVLVPPIISRHFAVAIQISTSLLWTL